MLGRSMRRGAMMMMGGMWAMRRLSRGLQGGYGEQGPGPGGGMGRGRAAGGGRGGPGMRRAGTGGPGMGSGRMASERPTGVLPGGETAAPAEALAAAEAGVALELECQACGTPFSLSSPALARRERIFCPFCGSALQLPSP